MRERVGLLSEFENNALMGINAPQICGNDFAFVYGEITRLSGIDKIIVAKNYYYAYEIEYSNVTRSYYVLERRYYYGEQITDDCKYFGAEIKNSALKIKVGFFTDNGDFYTKNIELNLIRSKELNKPSYANKHYFDEYRIIDVTCRSWRKEDKYVMCLVLHTKKELYSLLEHINPYGYAFAVEKRITPDLLLMCPQLEQLYKAEYAFAERIIENDSVYEEDINFFNRLIQKGNSIKDIFKTSKCVYSTLKGEESLRVWDMYRRMFKKDKIDQDTIELFYNNNYCDRDLRLINSILGCSYNNKKVFTVSSLQNYLGRLDMYEAIDSYSALQILDDYLRMCKQLNIEPKVDGDSLKREHDIVARNLRNLRREERNQTLLKECKHKDYSYLTQFNFEDDIYIIRGIKDYADLIDEANQQHNCVASYHENILKEHSLIYTLRYKTNPKKSYVTVELSPDLKTIRQRYLACNREVRDKSVTDFLAEWLKHIRSLNVTL